MGNEKICNIHHIVDQNEDNVGSGGGGGRSTCDSDEHHQEQRVLSPHGAEAVKGLHLRMRVFAKALQG
jgi:hypothetical protein